MWNFLNTIVPYKIVAEKSLFHRNYMHDKIENNSVHRMLQQISFQLAWQPLLWQTQTARSNHRSDSHNLISQCPQSTRSASTVTHARPPTSSSLWITNHSFQYTASCLWNQLPASLAQHHPSDRDPLSLSVCL